MISKFINECRSLGYSVIYHPEFADNGIIEVRNTGDEIAYGACQVDVRMITSENYKYIMKEVEDFLG